MKTFDYYGVSLTSLQGMLFEKYISTNGIAMNTKLPHERKAIAAEWLEKQLS